MSLKREKKKMKKMEQSAALELEATEELPPGPPPVQDVQPQRVPVSFRVGQIQDAEGTPTVQLLVFTPSGQQLLFLDPSVAVALAEALFKVGELASRDVEVPESSEEE